MITIDAAAHACALRCADTTIRIIELDRSTTDTCQGVPEETTEEHICLASMDFLYVHAHLLHDLHTIAETEHDAFMCRTDQMGTCMLVEVNALDRASYLSILQYTLCPIAERDDRYPICANRSCLS